MDQQSHDPAAPPPQDPEPVATIRTSDAVITFVQIWEVGDPTAQQRWLQMMHDSIHILQTKPGFLTMNLHSGLDGTRIAVYAQWSTPEALQSAVSDPEAVAAHERMAAVGDSDGATYIVDRVYTSST